ncbi:MAG: RelA/SpoT family protein [Oscillospiraceae bacterium]|jgi:guanosine-3',5'-bis(diphosphate) 3'-pyrophosphohydrolase
MRGSIEQYKEMEARIEKYNPGLDKDRLFKAFLYADAMHQEQNRRDGTPYVTHPLAVAEIVADMELDEDSIIAALLHDCIEDTAATYEEITKIFGKSVGDLVDGLTKLKRIVYSNKEEEQMENLRKMLMAMARDIRVILIKLADRLHNMRTIGSMPPQKQREKALETMEIYAPIAHRLGMQKIKWELEDLALLYLDPIGYKEINDQLEKRSHIQEAFMARIKEQIGARLEAQHIKAEIFDRIKHIYSLYRKMYSQNKNLEEVFDLYAFRVIVDTIPDCYNVLGVIHDIYKPILGRFKDYIGTPKPNMYQSLHTTVMSDEGIPFEVQIRTWEMHHTAEYGVAAHWKYKQGGEGVRMGDEEKFAWIRSLLEAQADTDAEEFVRTLKVDMFDDEVFVFTPSGDVINLPAGSTPIDFAYAIHSEVGNHMTGAKINGRIVTFDRKLQNGDIVNIITSPSAKGPSRDWTNIAQSNEAKTKIRQWFKRERREENIQQGKATLESELKQMSIPLSVMQNEELLPALLKKSGYSSLDDLYAAIGYGGTSAARTANRIRDELVRINRTNKTLADKLLELTPPPVQKKTVKSDSGIIVEGIDNCLVKFAKCCTPVPGDMVIGFITRGYGVSVHRSDCANVVNSAVTGEDKDRWINVSWAPPEQSEKELYQTGLCLAARDRDGVVADIATALAEMKVKVQSLTARAKDENATVNLTLNVKNAEQLGDVMRRLNRISGVKEVQRSGC